MEVWIIIVTFTVQLAGVDLIAQYSPWLFATQAACDASRPVLETHLPQLAPKGYTSPVTGKVSPCMAQRTATVDDVQRYLEGPSVLTPTP